MKKSVYKKSEELALEIMAITKDIRNVKKDYYMADQIFRSSTSVAANLREAKFSNTDKMYLHKLSISNFIEQEKNLIDYICYGLLIFAKKLNNNNYDYLNNIIFIISNCISYSSINSSFQYTFYKYLKLYNISNINIDYLPTYLMNLIHENNHINIQDNNNDNITKIKQYISEIERNIRHNNELKQVNISTNITDIEYNFKKC